MFVLFDLLQGIFGNFVLGLFLIADCLVLNIFATNLYVNGYKTGDPSEDEVALVSVHTLFYIIWGVANIGFMYVQIGFLSRSTFKNSKSEHFWVGNGTPRWLIFLITAGAFITALSMGKMAVTVFQGIETHFLEREDKTFMLVLVQDMEEFFASDLYHWIPLITFKLSVGWSCGLKFTFNLHPNKKMLKARNFTPVKTREDWGTLDPEGIVAGAHQLLAMLSLCAYLFMDPDESTFALLSAFRQSPYNFVFLPVFVLYLALLLVGLYAALERDALQDKLPKQNILDKEARLNRFFSKKMQRSLRIVVSLLWYTCAVVLTLTARAEFEALEYVVLGWALCIPFWVILTSGLGGKEIFFFFLWMGLTVGALYNQYVALVNLIIMCFLKYFVDDSHDLRVADVSLFSSRRQDSKEESERASKEESESEEGDGRVEQSDGVKNTGQVSEQPLLEQTASSRDLE